MRKRKWISKQPANATLQSLVNESDRGCVIVAASILEKTLLAIHETWIKASTYLSARSIFEDLCRIHGPLSSFAGLIQLAYGYGLIEKEDYEDLELIRHLRNEAAHYDLDFSLQDNGVRNHVSRLTADVRMKQGAKDSAKALDWNLALSRLGLSDVKSCLIANALALQITLSEHLKIAHLRVC